MSKLSSLNYTVEIMLYLKAVATHLFVSQIGYTPVIGNPQQEHGDHHERPTADRGQTHRQEIHDLLVPPELPQLLQNLVKVHRSLQSRPLFLSRLTNSQIWESYSSTLIRKSVVNHVKCMAFLFIFRLL